MCRSGHIGGTPRLTLLTRPGCHLCDTAREALARIAAVSGEEWTEVDITSDEDLLVEYGIRIPVVLLDGVEHGYWRVDEARLLRDLGVAVDNPASRSDGREGVTG